MKSCKTLNVTEYSGQQPQGDCNCSNATVAPIIFPDNYVSSSTDLILYEYSITQYIVKIGGVPCSIGQSNGSNGNWGVPYIISNVPFSIQVIGANPANVSFVNIPNPGINVTFTSLFGWSVTNQISGLCMIVDKDVLTPDIPKASTTTISIKMTPSGIPFTQQLKTEQFFNFNCDIIGLTQNGTEIENEVYGFPTTQVMISGGAIDNGTTYKVPIGKYRRDGGAWKTMLPYYSMRDIRITGVSPISVPNPGVTFNYEHNDGIWYAIIPKVNGTYYTNSSPLLQLDLETDTYIYRTATDRINILLGTVTATSGFLNIVTESVNSSTNFVSNQWV